MKLPILKEDTDMKKKIILAVAILAVVLLAVSLSSCGLSKNHPKGAWFRANLAMGKLDSYEIETEMNMTFYVNGHQVISRATGRTIEVDIGEKDQYFYQRTTTTVNSSKLGINKNIITLQAYHEGNYFLSNRGTEMNQRLYSPMTLKEALAFRMESSENLDALFTECDNAEIKDNGDGTRTLQYSGYKQSALDKLTEEMELDELDLEYEVVDMPVTITINADDLIEKVELSLTFDASEDSLRVPSISVIMTYSEFNTAEREVSSLKTENFVEVKDVRLLSQLEDMLRAREKEGSFTLSTKQTTKIMGQSSTQKETDTVTYGTGNNGYFYDIKAELNGAKYTISYQDGKQTVKGDGSNKSEKQTEDEAKDFINGLINTANYYADYVTNITEVSEGVYEIESGKPEATPYKNFFAQLGGIYTKATQTITITVEQGRIVKIEGKVEADGSITSGYNTYGVGLTIESTVTFE